MNGQSALDSFDHVVVLMLENRSFDTILGYLYEGGVPPGKSFDGVAGKALFNLDQTGRPVPVSKETDYHQPYPDPGEEHAHIMAQLTGPSISTGKPNMGGFVRDYFHTLTELGDTWSGSAAQQSPRIMRCFTPDKTPVLSTLAREFAVFDRWFCAVPSQTWCNRAFWHAATSWGWVDNPPAFAIGDAWNLENWDRYSAGRTLFDLLEEKFGTGSWRVYEDLAIPFTKLVHWGDLKDKVGDAYFRDLEEKSVFSTNFFQDCAAGALPKYAFLEPHFINRWDGVRWHDDMHPSSVDSELYSDGGPGSVLLGDQLVWKVYEAIRNSKSATGNNWSNTLLIITFDEHGGCYDHVAPSNVPPLDPSGFNTGEGQEGFDFSLLGVRVPMVMVSAGIARNTIVNEEMHHCSFLSTMALKWGLPSLGPRQDIAPPFTSVFSGASRGIETWPPFPKYPGPPGVTETVAPPLESPANVRLNGLQASILNAIQHHLGSELPAPAAPLVTEGDARPLLDLLAERRRRPGY